MKQSPKIPNMSSQNSKRPYGETGLYTTKIERRIERACGGEQHNGEFAPLCFICGGAIGRTSLAGEWKIKEEEFDAETDIWLKESEVEWSQRYRAILFNRSEDIGLSEVGHIIYHGPWLELLELPVKDDESGVPRPVEFYPLCYHYNEAEREFKTFGCTMHAVCWEFLEREFDGEFDGELQSNQLAKITQVLREQMVEYDWQSNFYHDSIYGVTQVLFVFWNSRLFGFLMCDPKDIPELETIYSACKKPTKAVQQSRKRGCKSKDKSVEELYARFPPEVKIMVIEYLEGERWSTFSDSGLTLQEYWQKRLFRRHPNTLVEAENYHLDEIDWQLLCYEMDKFAASKSSRGWQNRCRILNLVKETRRRYDKKADVKPTPRELMLYHGRKSRRELMLYHAKKS